MTSPTTSAALKRIVPIFFLRRSGCHYVLLGKTRASQKPASPTEIIEWGLPGAGKFTTSDNGVDVGWELPFDDAVHAALARELVQEIGVPGFEFLQSTVLLKKLEVAEYYVFMFEIQQETKMSFILATLRRSLCDLVGAMVSNGISLDEHLEMTDFDFFDMDTVGPNKEMCNERCKLTATSRFVKHYDIATAAAVTAYKAIKGLPN